MAFFYFISIFLVISIPSVYADDVRCTFSVYPIDWQYIDEYTGGEKWLNITQEGQAGLGTWRVENPSGSNKVYYYNSPSGSHGVDLVWSNWSFYQAFFNLTFNFTFQSSAGHTFTIRFYDVQDEVLGHIEYGRFGAPQDRVDIKAGSTERSLVFQDAECENDFTGYITIYSNETVRVAVKNGTGVTEHVWGDVNGFERIKYARHYVSTGFSLPALYTEVDNITIDLGYGETARPWELEYNFFGSVTCSGDEVQIGFNTISSYSLEIQKRAFKTGYMKTIKQVSLAVTDSTSLSNFEIYLQINDYEVDGGQYDTIYYYLDSTYGYIKVLTWTDIKYSGADLTITDDNMLFEFLIMKTSGTPTFAYIGTSFDVDADGDASHKGYADFTYWNGLYDGTTLSVDFLYLVYYNLTTKTPEEYGDVSNYSYWGDIYDTEYFSDFSSGGYAIDYEGIYNLKMNGYIYGVDWLVSKNMVESYGEYGILNYAEINVNGNIYDNADYLIPYSSKYTIIRWLFSTPLNINDDFVRVAFYLEGDFTKTIPISSKDINRDNLIEYKWTSKELVENVDIFPFKTYYTDPEVPYLMFSNYAYDGENTMPYDLVYRMYVEYTDVEFGVNYTDYIRTDKDVYQQYDLVTVFGTLGAMTSANSIHVYYDDGGWVDFRNQSLPKQNMMTEVFSLFFRPNQTGDWQVAIERGGVKKDYYNFTVVHKNIDYCIVTYPNPSLIWESASVDVMYNKSDSYDVRVKCFTLWKTYYFEFFEKQVFTHVADIVFEQEGLYKPELQRRVNSTFEWHDIIETKHIVKTRDYDCYLMVDYTTCSYDATQDVSYANIGACRQTIYFQHNCMGVNNLKLLINGKITGYDVADSNSGSVSYLPQTVGEYVVSLVFYHNGTYTYIATNVTFIVKSHTPIVQVSDEDINIVALIDSYLNDLSQFIVAMFIIGAMVILPAVISDYLKIQDMPRLVYMIFGIIGLGINIYLELWDKYILLMFVFVLTVIVVVNILGNAGFLNWSSGSYGASPPDNNAQEVSRPSFLKKYEDSYDARKIAGSKDRVIAKIKRRRNQ